VSAIQARPAYTPSQPAVRCMTPGHEDREARLYPGGHLCGDCLPVTLRPTTRTEPGEHR
jgi:hypothetical protein